jgi:hypothetical protein
MTDHDIEEAIQRHSGHAGKEGLVQALLVAGYFPNVAAMKVTKPPRPPILRTKEHTSATLSASSFLQDRHDFQPDECVLLPSCQLSEASLVIWGLRDRLLQTPALLLLCGCVAPLHVHCHSTASSWPLI